MTVVTGEIGLEEMAGDDIGFFSRTARREKDIGDEPPEFLFLYQQAFLLWKNERPLQDWPKVCFPATSSSAVKSWADPASMM